MLTQARWGGDVCKKLRIATNNILTFLDFALIPRGADPFDVILLPKGPFEPDYGATFGDLAEAVELSSPTEPRLLHQNAKPFVDREIAGLMKFFDEPGLILMTASGIEANSGSPFFGPHVGSYYNELVKRCLLSLGVPTVMFLDATKLPYEFRAGCYPVCGPDFQWNGVRQRVPLALVVSAKSKEGRETCIRHLHDLGFENREPPVQEGNIWPMIATNELFDKATKGWWG